MAKKTMIRKVSGEMEPFSRNKLSNSLHRSGADDETVQSVIADVESWIYDGITSKKIYDKAFASLRKQQLGIAARYKLKKAMMELGPTGYPFEFFVGQVFKRMGYHVEVGQVLQGQCVTHEVDVIATKDKNQHFIECKYYQSTGKNANVQVPMYIRSRVDDLINYRKDLPQFAGYTFHGVVVTNTRFTTDAISFGECTGLQLLSWDYPVGHGLKEFIDKEHIFPITVLTKLLISEKQQLMEKGIVICSQLLEYPASLEQIGLDAVRQRKVLEEVRFLCPFCP
ncbi:MAG TPA: restriction endonuclease [Bacteroidales bacterium]|nr:restriction endonuclease [Bacteroidales bacterium]